MQAIQAMTAKVGVGWIAPAVAGLVTLSALGGTGRPCENKTGACIML